MAMDSDEYTDTELVRRFQNGDGDAYEELIRRYQDRIVRMAAVWLYDTQCIEDAAQEVLLRGFKGLRSFRFRSEPFTWIYRTTMNVCREFNRRRPFEVLESEPSDPAADPEMQAHRYDAARRVRELVAALPLRQREVVVLRVFEDVSVRDAAKAMGCREGTVKALLHKATARLKLQAHDLGDLK